MTEADLWDLFTSFEKGALTQIGEEQNLLANLKLFKSTAARALAADFFEDIEDATLSSPMIVRWQFEAAIKTWEVVNDVRDKINDFVASITGDEIEIGLGDIQGFQNANDTLHDVIDSMLTRMLNQTVSVAVVTSWRNDLLDVDTALEAFRLNVGF